MNEIHKIYNNATSERYTSPLGPPHSRHPDHVFGHNTRIAEATSQFQKLPERFIHSASNDVFSLREKTWFRLDAKFLAACLKKLRS